MINEAGTSKGRSASSIVKVGLLALLLLAIGAVLVFQSVMQSRTSPLTTELRKIKQFGLALIDYSEAHEGALPETLELLEPYVRGDLEAINQYRAPGSGRIAPWRVIKSEVHHDQPYILVIAPFELEKDGISMRLVMWSNGSAKMIKESEVETQLQNAAFDSY